MKKLIALALVAATTLAAVTPALAHHSFSMFDPAQEIVIKGKVVRWAFNSPHTYLLLEDADGQVYAFEGAAPPSLIGRNPSMTGDTFKVGDELTVVQCPLRDGRAGGAGGLYVAADGTVYNTSDAGCSASQRAAEWPMWIESGYMSRAEAEANGAAVAQ